MPHRVGYCCINTTLSKNNGIYTGRTARKATIEAKGIDYIDELVVKNIDDLMSILKWNYTNGITLFRIGSGIFPWVSEYSIPDLPSFFEIQNKLQLIGKFIKDTDMRVSFHPDHFVKLASDNHTVVKNSKWELEISSYIFDMMGLPANIKHPINIHVGMNVSAETTSKFMRQFGTLPGSVRNRVVLENDDKVKGYSVNKLYTEFSKPYGIPITFDYFHHSLNPDGLTEKEAVKLAAATWEDRGHVPLFHYSESKRLNENVDCKITAHADYVYNKINDYGFTLDIDLEAKAKELALFKYKELHGDTSV